MPLEKKVAVKVAETVANWLEEDLDNSRLPVIMISMNGDSPTSITVHRSAPSLSNEKIKLILSELIKVM